MFEFILNGSSFSKISLLTIGTSLISQLFIVEKPLIFCYPKTLLSYIVSFLSKSHFSNFQLCRNDTTI